MWRYGKCTANLSWVFVGRVMWSVLSVQITTNKHQLLSVNVVTLRAGIVENIIWVCCCLRCPNSPMKITQGCRLVIHCFVVFLVLSPGSCCCCRYFYSLELHSLATCCTGSCFFMMKWTGARPPVTSSSVWREERQFTLRTGPCS